MVDFMGFMMFSSLTRFAFGACSTFSLAAYLFCSCPLPRQISSSNVHLQIPGNQHGVCNIHLTYSPPLSFCSPTLYSPVYMFGPSVRSVFTTRLFSPIIYMFLISVSSPSVRQAMIVFPSPSVKEPTPISAPPLPSLILRMDCFAVAARAPAR